MTIGPKKTLTSRKWLRRNDSTSVSTLLQPDAPNRGIPKDKDDLSADSDEEQPRRTILSQMHASGAEVRHKIYKSFCPECYCKSFPVVPSMGCPRDSCCCQQMWKKSNHSKYRANRIKSAPMQGAHVRRCLGTDHRSKDGVVPGENYTKRRIHYEAQTKDYFINLKQRLAELGRELKHEQDEIERKRREYLRMESQEEKQRDACCETDCEVRTKNVEPARKLKDVMQFRKDNYFACHSSATSLDEANKMTKLPPACTDSTCVHKCHLTEDLKLLPENVDEYGTSRCAHCQRALSAETLTNLSTDTPANNCKLLFCKTSLENFNLLPLSDDDDDDNTRTRSRTHTRAGTCNSEDVEVRDKMYMTTRNNEKLEVSLPRNFLKEAQKPITLSMLRTHTFRNFMVPMPTDSMALRFQKGMHRRVFRQWNNKC